MNANINIKSAATTLKSFVKECGGEATHSQALELLAKMCGFECYRALKAQALDNVVQDTQIQGQIRHTTAVPDAGQLLEDPKRVVFRSTAIDWRLADDPSLGLDDVPPEHRREYDFIVEKFGSQYRVMLKPEGVTVDNYPGQPILDMLVEVNEGVPCIHLTNDPSDAMLLTVFGTGEGIVSRLDDGDWGSARRDLPSGLRQLVDSTCGPLELHRAEVCVLDTGKKYEKPEQPSVAVSVTAAASIPTTSLQYGGLTAVCSLCEFQPSDKLLMRFGLMDQNGQESLAGQDFPEIAGPSSFLTGIPLGTPLDHLQQHAAAAAQMASALLGADTELSSVVDSLRKMSAWVSEN